MTPTDLFEALPDMAVFARVVDAGNFSEAARQLGSMPSTVSRQIKRLEQALGTSWWSVPPGAFASLNPGPRFTDTVVTCSMRPPVRWMPRAAWLRGPMGG